MHSSFEPRAKENRSQRCGSHVVTGVTKSAPRRAPHDAPDAARLVTQPTAFGVPANLATETFGRLGAASLGTGEMCWWRSYPCAQSPARSPSETVVRTDHGNTLWTAPGGLGRAVAGCPGRLASLSNAAVSPVIPSTTRRMRSRCLQGVLSAGCASARVSQQTSSPSASRCLGQHIRLGATLAGKSRALCQSAFGPECVHKHGFLADGHREGPQRVEQGEPIAPGTVAAPIPSWFWRADGVPEGRSNQRGAVTRPVRRNAG